MRILICRLAGELLDTIAAQGSALAVGSEEPAAPCAGNAIAKTVADRATATASYVGDLSARRRTSRPIR